MENEYWNESRYDEADVLKERFIEGNVIDSKKILNRLNYMHHKKVSEDVALKNLGIAYNYLQNNYEKISNDFKKEFSQLSKNKMLAYYIANLHDTEMERILNFAKEEQSLEER
jgi:hypothetical protein